MKDHLHATSSAAMYYPEEWRSMINRNGSCPDFSTVFKELFSLAALDLANQIHQPLEALGTLFEEPLETGRRLPKHQLTLWSKKSEVESNTFDLENSILPSFLGGGKFLLVTRQINRSEAAHLAAAGFRFASVPQITNMLSKTMELPNDDLSSRLQDMHAHTISRAPMSPGLYLACFMLRPRIRQGFDVLVPAKSHDRLPSIMMPYDELVTWQSEMLQKIDNRSVAEILDWLEGNASLDVEREVDFSRELLRALTRLVRQIEDQAFLQAKFSAQPVEVPCQLDPQSDPLRKKCLLLSFRLISTIHTLPPTVDLTFVPLRFFTVQQQVYMGVRDREAFAHEAYAEFAHCFDQIEDDDGRSSRRSSRAAIISSQIQETPTKQRWARSGARMSEHADRGPSATPEKSVTGSPGAIVVSNDVRVDISRALTNPAKVFGDQAEMGTTGRVSTGAVEMETFVDKLFALCRG
jgi:hypothetical protein